MVIKHVKRWIITEFSQKILIEARQPIYSRTVWEDVSGLRWKRDLPGTTICWKGGGGGVRAMVVLKNGTILVFAYIFLKYFISPIWFYI